MDHSSSEQGFQILATRSFERSLKKLSMDIQKRILKKLEELEVNPFKGRRLRGNPGVLYIRIGKFRVFYKVNEQEKTVNIINVSHRRSAYR